MTKKEMQEIAQQMLDVYSGILFHNQDFETGNEEDVIYEFDCPEFNELRTKYNLVKIAGNGSDFARAKRLLHYLAPRLTHSSWYDNHIECNALRLLEYSLSNPEQGINCLNKSKILVECCMALGIYARRVSIMPFSPYDFDNHVVAEIYDRTLEKWIMLDPTTDGYFIDETKTPLDENNRDSIVYPKPNNNTIGYAILCPAITFTLVGIMLIFNRPLYGLFGLGAQAMEYGKYMLLIYLFAGSSR